jgi:hypothetical protein
MVGLAFCGTQLPHPLLFEINLMKSSIFLSRRHLIAAMAMLPLLTSPAAAASKAGRVMVQCRPQDTGSLYKVWNIMPALDLLGGIRKVRCRDPYRGTLGWNTYVGLAQAGVKFCFTLSVRNINNIVADLKAFLLLVPGSIWALEYPNEPDLNPVTYGGFTDPRLGFRTGNAPALMAFIKAVNAAILADPVLRLIPRVASNDYMQAEQGQYTDFGNSHIYPRPTSSIPTMLSEFRSKVAVGGHRYGVITEWGRTTGGDSNNYTSPPVTLSRQASLLSSDIATVLAQPYVHTLSIYELFAWGGTSEMNNFGLFNSDLSPRPAVSAIRAVLA